MCIVIHPEVFEGEVIMFRIYFRIFQLKKRLVNQIWQNMDTVK